MTSLRRGGLEMWRPRYTYIYLDIPRDLDTPTCGGLHTPSCKVPASEPEGFQVRNPIPLKIRRVLGLLHAESYEEGRTFYWWYGAEVWRRGAISDVVLVICPRFKITRSSKIILELL
ncbi:hypothetical protein AVEN_180147-1 [Araneus ventricosus]|uniref:Uncharacterized protein n=1 Tax=Araneus ventricosus TaxID=182803 RepID=A0A4Y2D654_ARAVE|nr:hypothetical protein AVEN_180147-1 [Araneus ventricosus]